MTTFCIHCISLDAHLGIYLLCYSLKQELNKRRPETTITIHCFLPIKVHVTHRKFQGWQNQGKGITCGNKWGLTLKLVGKLLARYQHNEHLEHYRAIPMPLQKKNTMGRFGSIISLGLVSDSTLKGYIKSK